MMHTLWVMVLWLALWRLAQYAGMTSNPWLLGFAMFMAYLMCVVWYPIFPYNKDKGD